MVLNYILFGCPCFMKGLNIKRLLYLQIIWWSYIVEQDVVIIFGIFARNYQKKMEIALREVWNVVMSLKGSRSGTFVRQAMNVFTLYLIAFPPAPNTAFSLTWPASLLIYWNKRTFLHKRSVQFPQGFFCIFLNFYFVMYYIILPLWTRRENTKKKDKKTKHWYIADSHTITYW